MSVRSNQRNICSLQNECNKVHLCDDCYSGVCKYCSHHYCNDICNDFTTEPICKQFTRFPFVCSRCDKIGECKQPHYFYSPDRAEAEAEATNKMTKYQKYSEEDLAKIGSKLKDGIKRGLAPYVIKEMYDIDMSVPTIYNFINERKFGDLMNIDLQRKVHYKSRKSSHSRPVSVDPDYKKNRSYDDYLKRRSTLKLDEFVWEMDTVIGKVGRDEKSVLSLFEQETNLQLFFILEEHTSAAVVRVFDFIKEYLGSELFKQYFTVILTDNGTEFSNPKSIEIDANTKEKLTEIYYCEPGRPDQKAGCEKNHTEFRKLAPKSKSFNSLSQYDIEYISRNVNNYPRKSLNLYSPYQLAQIKLDPHVLELNNLVYVDIDELSMKPII